MTRMSFGKGPRCWQCAKSTHAGTWLPVGPDRQGYFCGSKCRGKYPPYEGDKTNEFDESEMAQEAVEKEARNY